MELAVRFGDAHGVARLLRDKGADINYPKEANCFFFLAAECGESEVVQAFLDAGADVNAPDRSGTTVLMRATNEGHVELVRILLNAGADINAEDDSKWAALTIAAYNGDAQMVKLLLWYGCNEDNREKALRVARREGRNGIAHEIESYILEWNPYSHHMFSQAIQKTIIFWFLCAKSRLSLPKGIALVVAGYIASPPEVLEPEEEPALKRVKTGEELDFDLSLPLNHLFAADTDFSFELPFEQAEPEGKGKEEEVPWEDDEGEFPPEAVKKG